MTIPPVLQRDIAFRDGGTGLRVVIKPISSADHGRLATGCPPGAKWKKS